MKHWAAAVVFSLIWSVGQTQSLTSDNVSWQYLKGGNQVAKDTVWDEPATLPLRMQLIVPGFTFKALGMNIDTFWIDQGGVFSVDEVFWIGLWEDLCDKGIGSLRARSPISIKYQGNIGNRITTVEWRNFGFYSDFTENGSCTDSGNIQLSIFENPQHIELWFGPKHIKNESVSLSSGVIVYTSVIDSLGNGTGIDLIGNPDAPQTTAVNEQNHATLSSYPKSGTRYSFDFSAGASVPTVTVTHSPWFSNNVLHLTSANAIVAVYTSQGAKIAETMASDKLDLNHLSPGIYTAQVLSQGKEERLQILITH
jgi:hypothetical protein